MSVYTLSNIDTLGEQGVEVVIARYGARLIDVKAPDKWGRRESICLHYININDYQTDPYYLGASIGRFPNRIGNAEFTLEGKCFELNRNHGEHQIHGGEKGLHSKYWEVIAASKQHIHLQCFSPDGEEGFPGNIRIDAHFYLNENNELTIEYKASTDKITAFAMTNHAYWNLSGSFKNTVEKQCLQLFCDARLDVGDSQIPTGKILPIKNTSYDFKTLRPINRVIEPEVFEGYDDYFIKMSDAELIAFACDPVSGRTLSVTTTEPGLQFYSGNFLEDSAHSTVNFTRFSGFCLEAHTYPNAPNHDNFPSALISPSSGYYQKTSYQFSTLPKN